MSSLQVLRNAVCVLGLCAALAGTGSAAAAGPPAAMVKDINTTVSLGTDNWIWESEFVDLRGTVVFAVDDGIHGNELWRSDGTPSGTALIRDVCPGVCPSFPRDLTVVGDEVFFSADDGAHGRELWKTDGTTAGTTLVVDLYPGLGGTTPGQFAALGELLIFSANGPTTGRELYRSDGTSAGTTLIRDIEPGSGGSGAMPVALLGGALVFSAADTAHGREFWRTDGTEAGTYLIKDINPIGGSHYLPQPTPGLLPWAEVGDLLFFAADDGTHGRELWKTDGTEAGTVLVKDINTQSGESDPGRMTSFQGQLFFVADDGTHGPELWRSDGTETGTALVKDIESEQFYSGSPIDLTVAGDYLYFTAFDFEHGRELWRSDGTEAGTLLVKDIRPGVESSADYFLPGFTTVGSEVLFFADDGVHGAELWRSNGTEAGTALVFDIYPGPGSSFLYWYPTALDRRVVVGGRFFFRALRPDDGFELWVSDGTTAGTQEIEIDDQTSSFEFQWWGSLGGPRLFADLRGTLQFRAGEVPWNQELWRSDGSAAGTAQVVDLQPDPYGSYPFGLATVRGRSLFGIYLQGVDDPPSALWLTDGTTEGTLPVETEPPVGPNLICAASLGGDLYFSMGSGADDEGELWKTDGSVAGTTPVSGDGPDFLSPCVALGDHLLFVAHGELWATDGSSAGTREVLDIWEDGRSYPDPLTVAGSHLFFSAYDDVAGRELWASDGTADGTHRVKDILPGPESGVSPVYEVWLQGDSPFAAVGDRVFFAADDGIAGSELWTSDGTEAGTHRVADILPGPRSSEIRWMTALGSRVFFVADDGVHGRELWTSDGTPAGTRLAADIFPGPESSLPQQLTAIGPVLLFSADDGVHGREPWRADDAFIPTVELVQDLAPGPLPSSPQSFTASGAFVYCAATDGTHGFELWRLRISPFTLFADGFEAGDTSAWSATAP